MSWFVSEVILIVVERSFESVFGSDGEERVRVKVFMCNGRFMVCRLRVELSEEMDSLLLHLGCPLEVFREVNVLVHQLSVTELNQARTSAWVLPTPVVVERIGMGLIIRHLVQVVVYKPEKGIGGEVRGDVGWPEEIVEGKAGVEVVSVDGLCRVEENKDKVCEGSWGMDTIDEPELNIL